MKHFIDYDLYKDYKVMSSDTELYEGNFISWLIRSRKFGDLISLKKVIKISKRIAELDYIYQKKLTEFQKENVKNNRASNAITIDQADELKSYKEEKINLNNQLQQKYGDSEFLMYTSEAIKNEEELKYIKQRRKEATNNKDKVNLQKLENIAKTQSELLKKQVEDSADDAVVDLNDVELNTLKLQKEKRDDQLRRLESQKLRFQTEEARAKTEFARKTYQDSQSSGLGKSIGRTIGRSITNKLTTNNNSDDDISVL